MKSNTHKRFAVGDVVAWVYRSGEPSTVQGEILETDNASITVRWRQGHKKRYQLQDAAGMIKRMI
jgi:hypothetical protein